MDSRYYTETEIDTNFYTSTQVDTLIATSSGDVVTYVDNEVTTVNNTITTTSGDIITYVSTTSGVTDHGNLTGLSDDDHSQYLLANGSRQLSSDWAFGSDTISGSGRVAVGDHAAATIPSTVNVIYGTGDPPGAGGYPEGTLYIKYVA